MMMMMMNKDGTISLLNSKPLKLVNNLTYFRSYISSTERDSPHDVEANVMQCDIVVSEFEL